MPNLAERLGVADNKWAVESAKHLVERTREDRLNGQVLNRRSGRLAGQIFYRKLQGPSFEFGTATPYGVFWEKGWTKSGPIYPHKANGVLAWRGPGGDMIFRRSSRFKAQKARPFLEPTYRAEWNWLQWKYDELHTEALNQAWPSQTIELKI